MSVQSLSQSEDWLNYRCQIKVPRARDTPKQYQSRNAVTLLGCILIWSGPASKEVGPDSFRQVLHNKEGHKREKCQQGDVRWP